MFENRIHPLTATLTAVLFVGVIAASNGLFAATAQADPSDTKAVNAPANLIHPGLLAAGATNNNASPNVNQGDGRTNDGGLHGIATGTPGQGGVDPGDGDPGLRDQLDGIHGGILDFP